MLYAIMENNIDTQKLHNHLRQLMRREGTVAAINSKRGMVAIATNEGFTIIELLSEFELEIDDSISWSNGFGFGHQIYENLTNNTSKEVYVQNHSVNKENLNKQLLL